MSILQEKTSGGAKKNCTLGEKIDFLYARQNELERKDKRCHQTGAFWD
jgi:hypothetical protein